MEEDDRLLTRIDEKVKHIEKMLGELVHRTEFIPVKLIAYGLAGGIMSAVLVAVIAQVLK